MRQTKTKDLMQIALMTAMLAVASVFAIPLGPVPITLQTFFFILIPALLGPKKGMMSLGLYLFIGLIGLPVFAGGTGGLQSVLNPSFGYILGAVAASLVIGRAAEKRLNFWPMLVTAVMGLLVIYTAGVLYSYWIMNAVLDTPVSLMSLIWMNMAGFLPLDGVKAVIAVVVYVRFPSLGEKKLNQTNL